jgi:plastocyanin
MHFTSFALRRGALLTLSLILGLALAACSGGDEPSDPATTDGGSSGGTATVEGGTVEISAADLEFDVTTIEAPAGEDFTITLVNEDSAPHNISIFAEVGGQVLATGPVGEAGATVTTEVTALEPGTYYFQCDLHPEMNGTLVVEG